MTTRRRLAFLFVPLTASAIVAAAFAAPPTKPNLPRPRVVPTPAAAAPSPNALSPNEYIPVDRLRPGMKGYGLTVFQGNRIERFDVTILGVLRKVDSGHDLIMVKLGGPAMSRLTGIAHGMSGSPVYVEGKLVGAVALGSQFTREPIGYLRPIADMFDAWDPHLPQSPDGAPQGQKISRLEKPVTVGGQTYTRFQIARVGSVSASSKTLVAYPVSTRIQVAGVSGARFRRIADALARLGLDAQPGPGVGAGSAGGNAALAAPLQPGGTLGMSLATGDIDLTATGTITYRRGNRILAFGHPFLGIGPLAAPLYSAHVLDLEPSFADSSIVAAPLALVGAVTQDRPFSISGTLGAKPRLVSLTVQVTDHTTGRSRTFHTDLIRHPQLTPTLLPQAADIAIADVHGIPGDVMATVTTEITADEVGTMKRTSRVYDSTAIDSAAISDLQSALDLLTANPFYPLGVRSARLNVEIEAGRQTAQVERIFLKRTRYAPGDTVEVGVVLKPYKQERRVETLSLRIPSDTPSGPLSVTVGGGASGSGGGALRIGGLTFLTGGGGTSDQANAATVAQLVRKWQERDRSDALVGKLLLPGTAISVQGEKLTGLPPNIEAALRGGGNGLRSSGVRQERDEVKVTQATPFVLSGSQSLTIRVARPGEADRPLSPFPLTTGIGGTPPTAPMGLGGFGTALPTDSSDGDEDGDGLPDFPIPAASPIPRSTDDAGANALRPNFPVSAPTLSDNSSITGNGPRPVGRAPGIWRQATAADFRAGTLDGVTITSRGDVRLAPRLVKVAESASDPYFWALAPGGSDGGVFVGSGNDGIVYRLAGGQSSTLTPWARTGELEVQSLARGADGVVYAGTAPHGRIFRIAPDGGKPTLLFAAREKYVLALALSSDGKTLYAATGGSGSKSGDSGARIYAIPASGSEVKTPPVVYEGAGSEDAVTALALGANGDLYAGTAPDGLVVRVTGAETPTVLYDTRQPSISGLVVNTSGAIFAATAPRGTLYQIDPNAGTGRVLYDRPPGRTLTNLQLAPDGTLYTASGATVIAVDTSGGNATSPLIRTFENEADIQILSLLRGEDGTLWAVTGNAAGLYRLESDDLSAARKGTYLSPILDAHATARWGTLRWSAVTSEGSALTLETRSGNTPTPDTTWSRWVAAESAAGGSGQIQSPPNRYLQYRALLSRGGGVATPLLRSIEAFYRTPNQAPQVTLLAPRGGEVWKGKTTIRWSGTDPDRDTLQYEVSFSAGWR